MDTDKPILAYWYTGIPVCQYASMGLHIETVSMSVIPTLWPYS